MTQDFSMGCCKCRDCGTKFSVGPDATALERHYCPKCRTREKIAAPTSQTSCDEAPHWRDRRKKPSGQNRPVHPNEIADEAKRIVGGEREDTYGGAEDSFAKIARFWTAYLQNMGFDVELTAEMVSPMMRLLKEARICAAPDHFDSHVDLVGYVLTGARVNGVKNPLDDS